MIAWTIDAARRANSVQRVFVSTDDAEIAAVSRAEGAEIIMRPAEFATNTASSESALLHALEHLEMTESYTPEIVVFLQCTSPLTDAEDIDGTVQALLDGDAQTALSVTPFHYFLWRHDEGGNAGGINHDKSARPLRQQRAPQYLETGAVYAMERSGFIAHKHRFFGRTATYVMPTERVHEVDDPIDVELAEARLMSRRQSGVLNGMPRRIGALVMDFDGVWTDNAVFVDGDGRELVRCSRSDGMGLEILRKQGLPMLVISKERNPVVTARCAKLEIPCLQGVDDKLTALRHWLEQNGLQADEAVYIGNDINDLACMRAVGFSVAVSDAHPEALAAARLVLNKAGGDGALRELSELLIQKIRGK